MDTSCLDHRDDYKADDNGSFRHQGKKVEHVELDDEGDVVKLDSKPDISKEGQYRLLRTYWVHKSNPQFKRRAIELEDSSGNLSPLVMLQYIFDGDPESITVKPHGRAKKNQRPFFTTASGTRTKISEKATSSMGPSSIYDHLYLEAGDVMSRKSSSDVPRSVDQVKYEWKKLRSKHEKDQLAELMSLSNNGFVRNVQVGPRVRAVLATEEQLADVVKFCTDPEEFGILGIDVTYNIGDFYVTTTSYQHLSMIDKSTGKHPTFPGPMMIHTDEKQATFHYFPSTLRENNSNIENILFVGSDRQRSMENGLAPQMPIAQFLACKKHVKDNVKMKLAALGILNKSEFLVDIFGNNTSRGLVDSESNEDFDARLLHLKDAWGSTPQGDKFYSYFVVHIAEDMKNRMILPIRRAAGLGDNFYYNNGTESTNSSLKSEIEKSKNASSPGKPSKCSYGEFVNIASGFVSRYRRNVHRAVVGDGPYKLAPNYQHFAVTEDSWRGLSKKEKVAKISAVDPVGSKKLHQFEMEGMSTVLSVPGPSQMEASVSTGNHSGLTNFPDFECSGLPEYLRGSWEKAQDVIGRNGVTKINESTMVVVSLTNPRKPHIVNRAGSKLTCDCERFKSETLCGHVFAVSHQENILLDVVASWEPKLSNIVSSSIPKRTGKKPGPQRYRPSRQAHERSVQDLEAPPAEYQFPEQEKFSIKWLLGSKITTCYGCKFKFRKTPSDPIPPEPYDIVLCRKQIRAYTPKGTTGLKFTAKPENTYFHLKKSCVQNDTSDKIGATSIVITEDDKRHLNQIHRNRLKQEFGVNIL